MVSTMASGDTRPYVGPSDICMMYSITDVSGINRISEKVLANAAHALAGMIAHPVASDSATKPALGLTMFGVTTACVQMVTKRLEADYDCLVFHATGVGGQSMEKLAERACGRRDRRLDHRDRRRIVGGVLSAGPTRMDVSRAIRSRRRPAACRMVTPAPGESVPERFKGRNAAPPESDRTRMRTMVGENRAIGEFLARKPAT